MVNLLLTTRCNRSCRYCFAKEKIRAYLDSCQDISLENVDLFLEFLEKSSCSGLQLAGGEPTMHPQFDEILQKILLKGFQVNLLTNGLWKEESSSLFIRISPTKLGFLLNIDHPDSYPAQQWRNLTKNLEAIANRENVTLSFNIFEKEPKSDYIFELLSQFGFSNIRISFSMPVGFGENSNSSIPLNEYRDLAPFIMDFIAKAEAMGALVRMDNTIPVCMFSYEQLGQLMLKEVIDPHRNFVCCPVVDVGPDLSIWKCFGTSGLFNKKLADFRSLADIYDYYDFVFSRLQFKVFRLEECKKCKYAQDRVCQGGCIGYSALHYINVSSWSVYDVDPLLMKPLLSPDIVRSKYDIPVITVIFLKQNREMMEIPLFMDRFLIFLDGKRTIREATYLYLKDSYFSSDEKDLIDDFFVTPTGKEITALIHQMIMRDFLIIPD